MRLLYNLNIVKTLIIIWVIVKYRKTINSLTGMKVSLLRLSLYKVITIEQDELAANPKARSKILLEKTVNLSTPLWQVPYLNEYMEPRYINLNLNNVLVQFKPNFSIIWGIISVVLVYLISYGIAEYTILDNLLIEYCTNIFNSIMEK